MLRRILLRPEIPERMRRPMARRDAKLDFEALMRSAEQAKLEIASWPMWKQQAAAGYFVSRPGRDDDAKQPPLTTPAAD